MKKYIKPKPGQESVWDYPRPPKLEKSTKHIRIVFNGEIIADTNNALRILETSHPPVYYIPQEDIEMQYMVHKPGKRSFCEWKGRSEYWDLEVGDKYVKDAAWSYPTPSPTYLPLMDHLAFYPGKMDACYVNDEQVQAQEGDFYGGWITSDIVGPFKGGPGTWGW